MWAHTKKHHIDKAIRIDINEDDHLPMSADEAIKKICGSLPEWAVALKGLRFREGLTQTALGKILGIEQTNITLLLTKHIHLFLWSETKKLG